MLTLFWLWAIALGQSTLPEDSFGRLLIPGDTLNLIRAESRQPDQTLDGIIIPGEEMYTIEYQWLNQAFTFLDSSDSDTIWIVQSADTYFVREKFFRFILPAPLNQCSSLGYHVESTLLTEAEASGMLFKIFPRDSNEQQPFEYPAEQWGQFYTFGNFPTGEIADHFAPPAGSEDYHAWLLNQERPATGEIILGLRTYNNQSQLIQSASLLWEATVQAVQPGELPNSFGLSACYPNPFNSSTSFSLELGQQRQVSVSVFNCLGQRIQLLFEGKLTAGSHIFRWEPAASSGHYFIRVMSPERTEVLKAHYLK